MNPVPAAVNAPRTPLVNLLPPEIEARRAQHRARFMVLMGMIAFLVIIAGAWYYAFSARAAAEDDLATAQALTPQKQTLLASYDYIPRVEADVNNSRNARAWVGQSDVNWANFFSSFFDAIPGNTTLTGVSVTAANPTAPTASDGTILGRIDVGQLVFVGQSFDPINVQVFQDAIDAIPGFQDTTITVIAIEPDAEGDRPYWTFSGATRITQNALSGRIVTEQEIMPIDTPSPEPTAAPESEG